MFLRISSELHFSLKSTPYKGSLNVQVHLTFAFLYFIKQEIKIYFEGKKLHLLKELKPLS